MVLFVFVLHKSRPQHHNRVIIITSSINMSNSNRPIRLPSISEMLGSELPSFQFEQVPEARRVSMALLVVPPTHASLPEPLPTIEVEVQLEAASGVAKEQI